MSTLERAIEIAARAHAGALDRAGKPYILHPLRVMMRVDGEEEKIVAVLHDVVEDSDWTLEGLAKEGFSKKIVAAVDALSRRVEDDGRKEPYGDFVKRAAANPLARPVKEADLLDNMDLLRLPELTEKDLKRVAKYHHALAVVRAAKT